MPKKQAEKASLKASSSLQPPVLPPQAIAQSQSGKKTGVAPSKAVAEPSGQRKSQRRTGPAVLPLGKGPATEATESLSCREIPAVASVAASAMSSTDISTCSIDDEMLLSESLSRLTMTPKSPQLLSGSQQTVASSAATEPRTSRQLLDALQEDCCLAFDRIAELSSKVSATHSSSSSGESIRDQNSWLLDMLLSAHNADITLDATTWDRFRQDLDNAFLVCNISFYARDRIDAIAKQSIAEASGAGASFDVLISRVNWVRDFVLDEGAVVHWEFFVHLQPRVCGELLDCMSALVDRVNQSLDLFGDDDVCAVAVAPSEESAKALPLKIGPEVTNNHERMLNALTDRKFIRGVGSEVLTLPDVSLILGATNDMSFCGRGTTVESVKQSIDYAALKENSGRSPIICVSGCAGIGKTRTCVEIGDLCALDEFLVLATTFNNNHSIQEEHETQYFQSTKHCHVPILMRLLHEYARLPGTDEKEFVVWSSEVYCEFGKEELSKLDPLLTLNYLRRLHGHQGPLLLIVDEMLMPWNKHFCNGKQTWQMMKRFYDYQRAGNKLAVLFSTLDNTCLERFVKNPLTERPFNVISLTHLDPKFTFSILSEIDISDELLSGFDKTREQLQNLLILNFGTVPRITEFCIKALTSSPKPTSFNHLLEEVSMSILQRYSYVLPVDLVYRCLFGQRTRPDEVFESDGITATSVTEAVRNAFLLYNPRTMIPDMLPHILFVQSVVHKEVPLLLRLLTTPRRTAHNVFEEAYRIQRIIFATTQKPKKVGEMFSPSMPFGGFVDHEIDQSVSFDSSILTYGNPPHAADISKKTMHAMWIPRDSFEPGIDSVMFLRLKRAPRDSSNKWLAVGIQNKWSDSPDEKITAPDLRGAEFRFRSRFTFRGWQPQNLLFVVVTRREISQYVADNNFQGRPSFVGPTLIISTNSMPNEPAKTYFDQHLGPTFIGLLKQFHSFPPQNSDYAAGDTLDAASVYTGDAWKVHRLQIAQDLGFREC